MLTSDGIPTPGGKKKWSSSTVKSILTNEKYKGDALLQKVYTEDFLTKKKIKNDGQVPQYYVENNHPAIIEPAVFDRVQKLMAVRHPGQNRNSCISPFSSKIKCGECGSWYGSKVWHSNDKYRKVIWQCNHKFDGDCKCQTPNIEDKEIKELFIKAMNILISDKEALIEDFETVQDTVFDTSGLLKARAGLQVEMNVVAEQIENCIGENARIAQDQAEYQKQYNSLANRYDRVKDRYEAVEQAIAEKQAHREMVEQFLSELKKQDVVTNFTDELWYSMIDHVTIYSNDDIRFTFQNGTEIKM